MATVSSGSTSERFGFIQIHGRRLGVRYLCDWLGVSPSGFYAWRERGLSARALEDKRLLLLIKKVFDEHHQTYGSPRVFHALRKIGVFTSRKRVPRLMRENGLQARAIRTYSKPAKVKFFYKVIENKRRAIGKPTYINQQWSGDITYLKVGTRWHYLAVVLDLYSRRIIGWSFGDKKTTQLTVDALRHAIKRRKPDEKVVFHSDRGAEYRAHLVQHFLVKNNIEPSMNRPGQCTDNAEVESFFHSLKADIIRGNRFKTANEMVTKLKSYLNGFYNRQRLPSSLGYKTPVEFESTLI